MMWWRGVAHRVHFAGADRIALSCSVWLQFEVQCSQVKKGVAVPGTFGHRVTVLAFM